MICQDCGVEAETKYVSFHQNIGVLVMRFSKTVEGNMCKSCIHKHFWSLTGVTAIAGWWGIISFILTPIFLLNNIGRYLFCLGMPAVPPGAAAPELTEEAVDKIQPHAEDLFTRLQAGEDIQTVVPMIATKAGVTPGQVIRFIQAVVQSQPRE